MQIPKAFRLGKRKIGVDVRDKSLKSKERTHIIGRAYPTLDFMWVSKKIEKTALGDTGVSETFWHEVTHLILHDMGDPRWQDEKFVVAFSKRLNQVINTAELE